MAAVKFSKQKIQPNPLEVDYWVDITSNPNGGRIKYHNGENWVDLLNTEGGYVNLYDYYTKTEINKMFERTATVDDVESKLDEEDVVDVVKDIQFKDGDDTIQMVMLKHNNTTVSVTMPVASQKQLQSLSSSIYKAIEEIKSQYQPKLIAGDNITIEGNTINANLTDVDYSDINGMPNFALQSNLQKEIDRATAEENSLGTRITSHVTTVEAELDLKADKSTTYTKSQVDAKLSGIYRVKGSCTFQKLPTNPAVGDAWNITNDFTLNGESYPLGTNVVYTESGWDALSGIFDTVALEEEVQTVADNLAKETVRATGVERTLDDKFNQYLPLTGGVLSGKLSVGGRVVLLSGNAIQFNNTDDTTYRLLFPYEDLDYSLGYYDSKSWRKVWDSGNDGANSGLDADLLDGKQPSELVVGAANKLSLTNINSVTSVAQNYIKFASIRITTRYSGYYSSLKVLVRTATSMNVADSADVYVQMYQQNALGETPFYTLRTNNSNDLFEIYGVLNYSSTESTLDLYVYGKGRTYFGLVVMLLAGDNIISIGSDNLSSLPSGTIITPSAMGSAKYASSATKLQTARTIWGQSFDGTSNIDGGMTFANGKYLTWKSADGSSKLGVFNVNESNNLYIGYDMSTKGYDTYIDGNNIRLRYGTHTTGMFLNSSGNVTIGSGDLASTNYKLYVDGAMSVSGNFYHTGVQMHKYNDDRSYRLTMLYQDTEARIYNINNVDTTIFGSLRLGKTNSDCLFLQYPTFAVGIGTITPSAKLHVAGDILATGTITQESQRDLKDIIDEKVLSLDDMDTINPTRFKWKDGRDEEIHYGGIAEDIQQVIPEVVHKPGDNLTVEYGNAAFVMVASLVKHVKELEQRLSKLEEDYKQLLLNNNQ